ncbi:MAG: alpha/beta hydrolase [Chloroflexi bacterium AL-W]|nr:alpha/beta hydrolase [Chloroflexi bacterium AL-W]
MNYESTLTLRDGRTLAYTIHGDAQGKPVFLFHGNPGSRYTRHPDETIAVRLGAKIITADRPGYGLSDFKPKRKLLDMADDIAQLADALKIDRFALLGLSAGAPYVAATAYALRDRVTVGAMVSGPAPFDRPGALQDVANDYRVAYGVAKWPTWALKSLMSAQMRSESLSPDKSWAQVVARASEYDQMILSHPPYAEQVRSWRTEAIRQGVRGWVQEAKLLVKKWGVPLHAIPAMIHLWYWQYDTLVPHQMGRYLEETLPNAMPHFMPKGGHFSFFEHWEDILQALVEG